MFSALALWFLLPALASTGTIEQLKADLQRIIDKHASFWNASMSFAIYNDTLEVAVASGRNNYADPNSYLTINKSIPMGSVTKMYTGVGVMRLVANGTISLDQTVAPLIDKYLARQLPCDEVPSQCAGTCWPVAQCWGGNVENSTCANFTAEVKAACSYCIRYLHCHCDDTTCPSKLTTKRFWDNIDAIEDVTFGQLISMESGVNDYFQDKTNWLQNRWLSSARDIEPLEFLAHLNKSFLFPPGSNTSAGKPRGAYSTDGFNLVGLALAGLFNVSSWSELDQRELAWGQQVFDDDQTLFPKDGICNSDPRIAHQYASPGPNQTFSDLGNLSCLNSWTGGNIAARPLDVARFTYKAFSGQLLNQASIDQMTNYHVITDGFGAMSLGYGLGLEGHTQRSGLSTVATPVITCGMETYGHAGQDYGSGAPLAGYIPKLKLGVTFAMTSAALHDFRPYGMNCSLVYDALSKSPDYALNDLLNTVMEEAAGVEPTCPVSSYDIPSDCEDAPSFGKINFKPTTCGQYIASATSNTSSPLRGLTAGRFCEILLEPLTIAQFQLYMAGSNHVIYTPPQGYEKNTTHMIDLCRGTCGAAAGGPCWMKGANHAWCDAEASHNDASSEKNFKLEQAVFV